MFQVGQVVEVLRGCTHQAFPVTPDVDKAFESAEPFDLHGMLPCDCDNCQCNVLNSTYQDFVVKCDNSSCITLDCSQLLQQHLRLAHIPCLSLACLLILGAAGKLHNAKALHQMSVVGSRVCVLDPMHWSLSWETLCISALATNVLPCCLTCFQSLLPMAH